MRAFRPSLRSTVATAAFLAFATWLILRVALRIDTRLATVATVVTLAALAAIRLLFWRGDHALQLTDDGLLIRAAGQTRRVAWKSIQRIELAHGDVETSHGMVAVQYARLRVDHGPPVAFADLSALDGAEIEVESESTVVYDVGDPEVLLGLVAERIDAREFLPNARPGVRSSRGPLLGGLGSLLVCLRAGFFGVLIVNTAEVLWDASQSELVACVAGVSGALAMMALVRVIGTSNQLTRSAESASLVALAVAIVGATLAVRSAPAGEQATAAAFALACALMLAMPVAPMPGATLARSAGFAAASQNHDGLAAVFIALVGASSALLLARGMRFLPLALIAAGAEGAEAYLAGLRNARLARAPRFSEWSADALSELRAMLRATYVSEDGGRDADMDRALLLRAESLRSARAAPWPVVLIAIAAVALGGVVAWRVLHGTNRMSSEALHVLLR